jgi:ribosomal protein L13E
MGFWYYGAMKTTLELPDELMRAIRVRAAQEDRKLKDVVAELLRRGLAQEEAEPRVRHRVKLPLVHSSHVVRPGEGLTPDEIKQILLDEEVEWALGKSDSTSAG